MVSLPLMLVLFTSVVVEPVDGHPSPGFGLPTPTDGSQRSMHFPKDSDDEMDVFQHGLNGHPAGGRNKRETVIKQDWTIYNKSLIDFGAATTLTYFHLDGEDYIIYGQFMDPSGSYMSEASFARWNGDTFIDIGLTVSTSGLSDIVTHFVSNKLLLTFLNSRFNNGSYEGRSKFCAFDGEVLADYDVQQFGTQGASSANYFDYEGETFLLVTNLRQDHYNKYACDLFVFQYQDTYFDLLLSHPTFGATDAVHFFYESFVYIVVGQYMDNDGNYDIGTPVYWFDVDEGQLKIVQTLVTSAVLDLEIFQVGFDIYLAVASERNPSGSFYGESVIFWWSGSQFIRYQAFPTYGAREWTHQKLDGGEDLIFLTHMQPPSFVTILEFEKRTSIFSRDWISTHIAFNEIVPGDVLNMTMSLEVFEIDDIFYLALTRDMRVADDFNTYESNFFYFEEGPRLVFIPPEDPLLDCQDTLEARVNESTSSLDYIMDKLNNSLKTYGPQEISGPAIFGGDVYVEGNFTVTNLTVDGDHSFNIDPEFIAQVEGNQADLLQLSSQFPYLVSLTEDETIQGYTAFQDVVHINHTLTGNISALYFVGTDLNGCLVGLTDGFTVGDISSCEGLIDIEDIDENALRLAGDQNVTGHVTFQQPITVEENITVEDTVNGLDIPDDLMLTYSDQNVTGVITFDTNLTFEADVSVDGSVNSLDMASDVVTTTAAYTVGGYKRFTGDVRLEDAALVTEGKTVDGVDLSEFSTSVVLLDEANRINGSLTFVNQSVMESDLSLANHMINEVNVTALDQDAVLKTGNQTITGQKYLRFELIADADITVTGEVNSVDLSENVVPLDSNQTINTPVRFQNVTVGADIVVDGTVNGIDLSEEAVLTYGNQTITGRVNFTQTMTTSADILFPPGIEIDSVDVSELDLSAVSLTDPEVLTGKIIFTQPVRVLNDTTVEGLINGVNITQLDNEALSKSRAQTIPDDLDVSANVTIDGNIVVDGTVDGLQISDFIPIAGDTSISGHKTFSDPLTVNSNITLDEGEIVNCEDLTYLSSLILLRSGNQTLRAPNVYLYGQLNLEEDLFVDGLINGFDVPDDFVTLSGEQTITGKKIFTSSVSVLGQVNTTDINVGDELQGVDVSDFYRDAVQDNTDTVIGKKIFTSSVSVLGQVNTTNVNVGDELQGVDVNGFYRDAVQNNTDTVIAGQKSFNSITAENNLNVTGTVDGVDLEEFVNTIVTLDGDQDITGNWTMSGALLFEEDVNVTDTVNGDDMDDLEDRTVYLQKIQTVTGQKTITGRVTIEGDLDTDGLINGLDLQDLDLEYLSKSRKQILQGLKTIRDDATSDDLYLSDGSLLDGVLPEDIAIISQDTSITVHVTFNTNVSIIQDLNVDGLINGVNVLLLNNTAVYRDIPQNISGVKTFSGPFAVIGNITTPAFVNGIDISELVLVAIGPNDTAVINAPIVFNGSVQVLGNWNMTGLFHHVDLHFLMRDAMLIDTNQTVYGNKYFADPSEVSVNDLDVMSDLLTDVIADGVSLENLLNTTVTASTDQQIAGVATFKNDVILQDNMLIDGLLDGIDLSETAVLIEGEQTIDSDTLFQDGFTVNGNLSVTGLVDTVDLEAFDNSRVSLSKEQTIEGTWTFQDDVTIENLVVLGKINDIDPIVDPVYKDRNHTITGWKNWQGHVVIQGDADIALINGIDLYNITGIVLTRGTFVIDGPKVFASNVTISDSFNATTVTGLVDGISIYRLIWLVQYTTFCLQTNLFYHEAQLQHLCYPTYSLGQAAYGLVGQLQYFEDWFRIENPAAFVVDQTDVEGGILMLLSESYTTAVPRCIRTDLHLCPNDERGCHRLTDDSTLPGSRGGEVFVYSGTTFVILTPSPQSVYCPQERSGTEMVVYALEDDSFNITLSVAGAVDVTGFEIEGEFYLIVAVFKDPSTDNKLTNSSIFQYDNSTEAFTLVQEIPTDGADSVDTLYDGNDYWIAFGNGNGHTTSKIYMWANNSFIESASIDTTYASDVGLFSVDGGTYAVFANEMKDIHGGFVDVDQPITLYRYSSDDMVWRWAQSIQSHQTIDLEMFGINDFWYLAAVSRQGFINIFQWTYPHSFQPFLTIPIEGAERVVSFSQGHDLFLAVTAPSYLRPSNATGGVEVLRAVIRGHERNSVFVT